MRFLQQQFVHKGPFLSNSNTRNSVYLARTADRQSLLKRFTQIDAAFFAGFGNEHLLRIAKLVGELIADAEDLPDGFVTRLELGFCLGQTLWPDSAMSRIAAPISSTSGCLRQLRICRISWGSPVKVSSTLENLVLALGDSLQLEELVIFDCCISAEMLEAIVQMKSTHLHSLGLPRSEFFTEEFPTSEEAMRALERLMTRFSKVERLSLPGRAGVRFSFQLLICDARFPHLKALDLPYWCNEHAIFCRAASSLLATDSFEACRQRVARYFNLPQLTHFTIDCKDILVENLRRCELGDNAAALSAFCFHSQPTKHRWLATDLTIDSLTVPLAILQPDLLHSQVESCLSAIRSFATSLLSSAVDIESFFTSLFCDEFLRRLCSLARELVFEEIVDGIAADPFLATAVFPERTDLFVSILGARNASFLESQRRAEIASRLLRAPGLLKLLKADARATDALGNSIFHLTKSPQLIKEAAAAGCGFSANKKGELPILALLQLTPARLNDRGFIRAALLDVRCVEDRFRLYATNAIFQESCGSFGFLEDLLAACHDRKALLKSVYEVALDVLSEKPLAPLDNSRVIVELEFVARELWRDRVSPSQSPPAPDQRSIRKWTAIGAET